MKYVKAPGFDYDKDGFTPEERQVIDWACQLCRELKHVGLKTIPDDVLDTVVGDTTRKVALAATAMMLSNHSLYQPRPDGLIAEETLLMATEHFWLACSFEVLRRKGLMGDFELENVFASNQVKLALDERNRQLLNNPGVH